MDIFVSHRYHISTEFCRCFSKLVTILVSPQNEHMVWRKATSFVSISCRSKGNDLEVLTGLRHSFFLVLFHTIPYYPMLFCLESYPIFTFFHPPSLAERHPPFWQPGVYTSLVSSRFRRRCRWGAWFPKFEMGLSWGKVVNQTP